ncbi:MAG: RimJ/RimL family protein N-acetyltransferase [Dinoroseobacter sp.]
MIRVLGIRGSTMLRRLSPSDTQAFLAYRRDRIVARHQGWSQMDAVGARRFLGAMQTAQLFPLGDWCQIGIVDPHAPQRLLGDMGLGTSEDGHRVEIGITLARTAQRRGHATRALALAIRLVWTRSAAARIVTYSDARNLPSIHLTDRLGLPGRHKVATVFQGAPCIEVGYIMQHPTRGGLTKP